MVKKITRTKRARKQPKRQKTRRRQRGGQIPDPIFPTKEKVLGDLGEWKSIHCLKYKRGSVMVIENDLDTKGIAACSLFKIHNTIQPDILYQYIMYKVGDKIKLLLSPTYAAPEIGTKHRCLLQRVPDRALILGSGELLRRDDTIFYSSMSSLFFSYIFRRLFPTVQSKEKESVKQFYEENNMMEYMRAAIPEETRIIYVKDINTQSPISKGASNEDIETGPLSVKGLKPEDFCSVPPEERPSCLRYVTDGDCRILEDHPGEGYCDAGIDFCSNLGLDEPPSTQIPESEYVFLTKPDEVKSVAFLKEQGLTPSANKFMNMSRAKQIAAKLGTPEAILSRQQRWPPKNK